MNETLKVLLIVAILFGIVGFFALQPKTPEKITDDSVKSDSEKNDSAKSGDYVDIPSIGMSEAYENYTKTFKTYKSSFGFSFKYPPHLAITVTPDMPDSNWIVLESLSSTKENKSAIIISIGLNDEEMTPEEWLLGPTSGFKHSEKYFKTKIDEQDAVYTGGGMWTVVNTPDNKYRLSIADLTTGNGNILFSEMGIVIESLTFN